MTGILIVFGTAAYICALIWALSTWMSKGERIDRRSQYWVGRWERVVMNLRLIIAWSGIVLLIALAFVILVAVGLALDDRLHS